MSITVSKSLIISLDFCTLAVRSCFSMDGCTVDMIGVSVEMRSRISHHIHPKQVLQTKKNLTGAFMSRCKSALVHNRSQAIGTHSTLMEG
jgi:hypothetical protein